MFCHYILYYILLIEPGKYLEIRSNLSIKLIFLFK